MGHISVGLDIGSTTIKAVVLAEDGKVIDSTYVRHQYRVQETLQRIMLRLAARFSGNKVYLAMTGMGAIDLSSALQIPFVQEVVAEGLALRTYHEQVDVAIELGGEDAKVTYFDRNGQTDQRMNRMCAGGTGAFLEHMASFFGVTMEGFEKLAKKGKQIYPIASRCGVYATTDIQSLLNQGVSKEDLALSAFQAVVNQVISDLAKGRPMKGKVAFLGGPLTFLTTLRSRFEQALELDFSNCVPVTHGELYGALGAALWGKEKALVDLGDICDRLQRCQIEKSTPLMAPLFRSTEEYQKFQDYYKKFHVPTIQDRQWPKQVWLGIDAGSTTMKLVLMDDKGQVVYQKYRKNEARIWETARDMLLEMYASMPSCAQIVGSGITGYGEEFLKKAFQIDTGEVETMAHLRAARFFCPEVTDLLDIGGQDMKYISLRDGIIQKIVLNGACASGCGLFLETFAHSLGLSMDAFVQKAVKATHQLDLGYRCTVLMNSKIHQVQNEDIEIGDMISGLCMSVVKNALYRVIHLQSIQELGSHIVVEGGTFCNDAVLRSFERLVGHSVIRPDLSGLMGAYGMALLAKERKTDGISALLTAGEIRNLKLSEENISCPGCGNHCALQKKVFSSGQVYITGNRCFRGLALASGDRQVKRVPNLSEWEKEHIFHRNSVKGKVKGRVGILRSLQRWSDFSYWQGFWNALGYGTIVSDWDTACMGKSLSTIPQGVYCYPCKAAHGHLMNLLEKKKPDFIWMPVTQKGMEEPELDELSHSSYGDVLASAMQKQIEESGISFFHPQIYEIKKDVLTFMKREFPHISSTQVKAALQQAEDKEKDYREQLKQKTIDILAWMEKEKKHGLVLLGRNYHIDPEINKGLPAVIAQLGIPVLTAEGLYQLKKHKKEEPTFSELALYATSQVVKNPYLHLVQLQSTSCGYDGMTMQTIRYQLQQAGEIYTILNLDQGISTGSLQIRIRSLMAELAERRAHPKRAYEVPKVSKERELPPVLYIEPLGASYDTLLSATFEGAGYEVRVADASWFDSECLPKEADDLSEMGESVDFSDKSIEQAVLVFSSKKKTKQVQQVLQRNHIPALALFFGLGRKQNDCILSTSLLHRVWMALFLGDVFLRCSLALKTDEMVQGDTEIVLQMAEEIGKEAIRKGSFASYEKALQQCVSLFSKVKRKNRQWKKIGIAGYPGNGIKWVSFLQSAEHGDLMPVMQGWGEWLLNELTELYFLEGFQGNMEQAQLCMASRSTAHTCLEMVIPFVNDVDFLEPLETPEEKKEHLNQLRKHPETYLAEPYRDLIRRQAGAIICVSGNDHRSFMEIKKCKKIASGIRILLIPEEMELSTQTKNRVEMFLENGV